LCVGFGFFVFLLLDYLQKIYTDKLTTVLIPDTDTGLPDTKRGVLTQDMIYQPIVQSVALTHLLRMAGLFRYKKKRDLVAPLCPTSIVPKRNGRIFEPLFQHNPWLAHSDTVVTWVEVKLLSLLEVW